MEGGREPEICHLLSVILYAFNTIQLFSKVNKPTLIKPLFELLNPNVNMVFANWLHALEKKPQSLKPLLLTVHRKDLLCS